MNIYNTLVFPSKLISPINGKECKRLTKQNIRQFGFDTIDDLHSKYPEFPLLCSDLRVSIGKDPKGLRKEGITNKILQTKRIKNEIIKVDIIKYDLNPKICPKCSNSITYYKRNNKFCSKSCGSSRNHSEETKFKIREGNINFNNNKPNSSKNYFIKIKVELKCKQCCEYFYSTNNKRNFCSMSCSGFYYGSKRTEISNKNKNEKQIYKDKCKFKFDLKSYTDEFDFALIEKYGWYSAKNHGNNLHGVSRDHMISTSYGFKNNIDPNIISHPANCMLLQQSKNASKGSKISISLDQLLEKIHCWNIKYGGS